MNLPSLIGLAASLAPDVDFDDFMDGPRVPVSWFIYKQGRGYVVAFTFGVGWPTEETTYTTLDRRQLRAWLRRCRDRHKWPT